MKEPYKKQTKINLETQFSISSMLKDEIEKKKPIRKKNSNQPN